MTDIAFKPIYLEKNGELGNALRIALQNCSFPLVARMDSDDVSYSDRFRLQLQEFNKNQELDIVGGNITEFVGSERDITGQRTVRQTDMDIKADMKKRVAMNHVSVMYKKDSVQASGGYLDWPWNEDYYLWICMMEKGCNFANVRRNLVNVRTGADMSARRGGWNYFKSERGIQKYMLKHKIISLPRYLYNVALRFGGEVVASNTLREKLFRFYRAGYKAPAKDTVRQGNLDMADSAGNTEGTGMVGSTGKGARTVNEVHIADKAERVDITDNAVADKPVKTGKKKKVKFDKESYPKFSVAISVYGKDNAEWFDRALESILVKQTVKPDEVVLVVDGPVPEKIQRVIDKYARICLGGGGYLSEGCISPG